MATLTNTYQKIGEKYLGNSSGNLYIRIYAKYSEQDIINNKSKVQYQARAYFTGNYIYDQQSSGNVSGTGASRVNYSKSSNYTNGETTLGTTEGWVDHDNDGKATISGSAYLNFPNWGWSGTASGSADLPTIPRGSTITATSAYIEETSQLTITRYNNNYTHSIYYSFGSLNGYILENGTTTNVETKISATSIGFPIPSTWYAQIPNKQQEICTLIIKTYNENTQIGDAKTTTFYVRVNPSNSSPAVTSTVIDINNTTIALTGNNKILIKGYSNAQVSWRATAKNSASISNVKINGTTVSTSPTNLTLNSNALSVVATDSRGLATTSNPEYIYKDYFVPTYTINAIRVAPTSDYVYVQFSGSWFNQNFGDQNNLLTIKWYYKEHGTSNWIMSGTLTENADYKINGNNFWSGNSSSISQIQLGGALLYAKSWDIAIDIDDKLAHRSVETTITQGIPIVNWESDFFNVNGDIRHNNNSLITYLDDKLEYFNDTPASDWQELIRNKLQLLVQKTQNENNAVMFLNGGWSGVNFLWAIGSKKGSCYDVVIFADHVIYLGRLLNNNYTYEVINSNYYGTYETQVGTWLGVPLYRKVINVGSLPNNNSLRVNHNISNLGQFTKIDGVAVRSSDNDTLPIPYATFNANNSGGITIYVDNTNVVIRTTTDRSSYNGYVILEYTKN